MKDEGREAGVKDGRLECRTGDWSEATASTMSNISLSFSLSLRSSQGCNEVFYEAVLSRAEEAFAMEDRMTYEEVMGAVLQDVGGRRVGLSGVGATRDLGAGSGQELDG